MLRNIQIIGSLILLFTISSCQEEGLLKEISQTQERAENLLDQINQYKEVDLSEEQKEAHKLVQSLSPHFNQLKGEALKTFVNLANVEKANKKIDLNFDNLEKEVKYSIEQLSALHRELKQNELTIEKAQDYLSTEIKVLKKSEVLFKIKENDILNLQERYQSLIPKNKAIADSILIN